MVGIKRIISGGQTGADRGSLDAAIDSGYEHGGWCPRGRKAADGTIPERYNLQETEESDYPPRTEKNVLDGDGTLVFSSRLRSSPGSRLTRALCAKHNKPCISVDIDHLRFEISNGDVSETLDGLVKWVNEHNIEVLNVAGSRESKAPGIWYLTYETITRLLQRVG